VSVSRHHAVLLAIVVLAACAGEPQGSPSAATPSPSRDPISGQLPPGCQQIDLRGPDGQPIDLTGMWSVVVLEQDYALEHDIYLRNYYADTLVPVMPSGG
jgi:hypothetical protein